MDENTEDQRCYLISPVTPAVGGRAVSHSPAVWLQHPLFSTDELLINEYMVFSLLGYF